MKRAKGTTQEPIIRYIYAWHAKPHALSASRPVPGIRLARDLLLRPIRFLGLGLRCNSNPKP